MNSDGTVDRTVESSRGVVSPDPPLTPPDMRARIRRFVRLI